MVRRHVGIAAMLRQRMLSDSHLGVVRAGDRLPSVRTLARELSTDPRVILTAYRELERQGLVELRPRSGMYVAGPLTAARPRVRRREDWLVDLLLEGLASGVSLPRLCDRLPGCVGTVVLRAACVECNADQLASLTGELRADYGIESVAVDVGELRSSDLARDAVGAADLLVTTPFHVQEVQAAARVLGKPWLTVSLRRDLFAELSTPDAPAGFFVVADSRFAAKLPRLFAATPFCTPPVPVVVGQDDLDAIPVGAPAYVTRLARERLGDCALTRRVPPVRRVFSVGSARRILSFLVDAHLAAAPSRSAR